MSKIGQKSIQVPATVQVDIKDRTITVKGSKGQMQIVIPQEIAVERVNNELLVKRSNDQTQTVALHGLYRNLIANAVAGVEIPWTKRLELVGTGYNVKMQGTDLVLKVGYSHPIIFNKVEGITYQVEGNTKIIVSGVDKQMVGQVAYQIKILKKPDAYKGKGIRYEGEVIRLKPGKKAKTTAA